ncbi:kielin/chordin-like protein [Mytilus edulis]|uniref:kielin/chordin-like protein n=1 Tax=Mytilus edulis TaxID=6550 RepID=UPI0039F1135B
MATNVLYLYGLTLTALLGITYGLLESCPHPCMQGGHRYCHPIPCPHPPCNNSFTPEGACCPVCPNSTDCPHPCTQGGRHFCEPIPCPKPPCDNPVTPTGACCAECKNGTDCPHPCMQGGKRYCRHIPCPAPPCNNSFVPYGACCPVCPNTPDCPHPCKQGGSHFCGPIPCPKPPCDDPVTIEGTCCPQCPKHCPHPCTVNGHKFCYPPPCPPPLPNCTHTHTPPGECCAICNDTMVTTAAIRKDTTDCPYPCEQGGQHYCHPLPCPMQPCADRVLLKGACCESCPNGPNCMIEGHIFPAFKDIIHEGKLCRCTGLTGKCNEILAS